MKRSTTNVAVLAGAALLISAPTAFAQAPNPPAANGEHQRITPEQKQASDQAMQQGLGQLRAAAADLNAGSGQVMGDLQAAISSMTSALPIYRGHRERAIHAATIALQDLQRNGKRSVRRAYGVIGRAIADAQAALQTN
jgi:hypothetical protein